MIQAEYATLRMRCGRIAVATITFIILIVVFVYQATSTISPAYTIAELTQRSDLIIRGMVLSVESKITPNGKSINT